MVAVPVISFRSGFGHSSPKSGFPQIGSAEIGNRHLGTMQSEGPKRHGVIGRTGARRARDLARCASSDDQGGVVAEVVRSYNRDGTVCKGHRASKGSRSVTLSISPRGERVIDHNRGNMEPIRVTEATARFGVSRN